MPLVLNGTTGVQDNSGAFVAGTAVASTSGTSIDFTSIPSWVKRVTILFNNVSGSGSSPQLIQIGSGSVTTSGYSSMTSYTGTNAAVATPSTAGFIVWAGAAGETKSGQFNISLLNTNNYVGSGVFAYTAGGNYTIQCAGSAPTLGGALDRVRITTVNGTDTFDAGSINILYE
jgi:hypothetical protein